MGGECDCDPAARARSEIGDGRDDGDTQREVVTSDGRGDTDCAHWLAVATDDDHNVMNNVSSK